MARPRTKRAQLTADSFQNFATNTGIGAANLATSGGYGFNPVTRNRLQLEWAYRGSWIVGIAVDCVAEDMTREGAEIRSDDDPDRLKELEKNVQRLQLWSKLCEVIKWARLYGGAVGYLMIEGQDPATPLNIDSVRRDQFKGIAPLDRWSVWPSVMDLVTEMGPELGLPKYYDLMPDMGTGLPRMRIHHSRLIRVDGLDLPYWQRQTENYWGLSIIERIWDRLVAFDSTTQGAAQLVYKAHLRVVKIAKLRDLLAQGGPGAAALAKNLEWIRARQSNEGMTVLDANDDFAVNQYSFSGLSDVMLQFGQQISGALQIPLVRLFGQSPAGLNSTGESDLRTYYDNVKQQQESRLRPGVERLYEILYRSVFGKAPDKTFTVEFKPLWQMSDEQRAQVTQQTAAAVTDAYTNQIIDRQTALEELKQLSMVTGVFSNITDEAIHEAEDDPPPGSELLTGPVSSTPQSGQDNPGGAAVRKTAA